MFDEGYNLSLEVLSVMTSVFEVPIFLAVLFYYLYHIDIILIETYVVESLKKNKDFIFLYLSLVNLSMAFKGETI